MGGVKLTSNNSRWCHTFQCNQGLKIVRSDNLYLTVSHIGTTPSCPIFKEVMNLVNFTDWQAVHLFPFPDFMESCQLPWPWSYDIEIFNNLHTGWVFSGCCYENMRPLKAKLKLESKLKVQPWSNFGWPLKCITIMTFSFLLNKEKRCLHFLPFQLKKNRDEYITFSWRGSTDWRVKEHLLVLQSKYKYQLTTSFFVYSRSQDSYCNNFLGKCQLPFPIIFVES